MSPHKSADGAKDSPGSEKPGAESPPGEPKTDPDKPPTPTLGSWMQAEVTQSTEKPAETPAPKQDPPPKGSDPLSKKDPPPPGSDPLVGATPADADIIAEQGGGNPSERLVVRHFADGEVTLVVGQEYDDNKPDAKSIVGVVVAPVTVPPLVYANTSTNAKAAARERIINEELPCTATAEDSHHRSAGLMGHDLGNAVVVPAKGNEVKFDHIWCIIH